MKKLLPLFILSAIFSSGKAQNLLSVHDTLDFGTATEISGAVRNLKIFNSAQVPQAVTDVDFFNIYGDPPFTLSDTAFTVQPGDTHTVQVTFLPEHNIDHEMALVVKTRTGFGDIAVCIRGIGNYSETYYSSTQNKSEQALKSALSTKLGQNYNSLGYTTARDNMYGNIDNYGGDVTCVYTGRTATFNTRAGANSKNFNCEHTFPQGMFNSNEPMRSDIHHLFPTDVSANSQRGNDPFGVVSNASWSQGGSKSGNGKFEPRDAQKGRTARAMMYFVLRYQDYNNFFQSQENILRQWHDQYPPDSLEKSRNTAIAALQTSRNPFVDYPQFGERITSLVSNAAPTQFQKLYMSQDTIFLGQGQGTYTYRYVLYNDGNSAISLDSFMLSDPDLQFAGGNPGTVSLDPQEFYEVDVQFNASKNYSTTLGFESDINGQTSHVVPIRSGLPIRIEERPATQLSLYPNPTTGLVQLSLSDQQVEKVWVSTMTGKRNEVEYSTNSTIDFSQHIPGIYLITVLTKSGQVSSAKILVQ